MKRKLSFKELVSQNKSEILKDQAIIEKIEQKIDKKLGLR
ncbi:FbpB family small basic protein [Terrilactibacillus laevilacticus]|uniref:FbpB family small basic protein n=1 Tax=Terrilactibacillus laevilacticus TaxID=1380157 RepID=A0ABW5PPJ3_9BACI|nr:FbpB family small basic protein [Terrilactibacillus laevilacticus]